MRLIQATVRQRIALFSAYRDWGYQDLVQECLVGHLNSVRSYNPRLSRPQTFITQVARNKLTDKLRVLARRKKREDAYASGWSGESHAGKIITDDTKSFECIDIRTTESEELVDWLDLGLVQMRNSMQAYGIPLNGHGLEKVDRAQLAMMMALKNKLGLSASGVERLLKERPALARTLGLKSIPSRKFFVRMPHRIKTIDFTPMQTVE